MNDKILEAFTGTRKAGAIAADTLDELVKIIQPGITTNEIDSYLAETAAALTVEHPDYSYLAGRI